MKNLPLIILGTVAIAVCGCSTQTGESHAGVYTTGADMMDAKEIALPANYDVENLDRKLRAREFPAQRWLVRDSA